MENIYRMLKSRIFKLMLILIAMASPANSEGLEWSFGVDTFINSESKAKGLNQLSMSYEMPNGFYFGQSLYSGFFGKGDGLFIGGIDFGKRFKLKNKKLISLGAYLGGGGGGGQVSGDGTMIKPHISLEFPYNNFTAGVGISAISIDGSDISSPALSYYIRKPFNISTKAMPFAKANIKNNTIKISPISVKVMQYIPTSFGNNSLNSPNNKKMNLIGGEFIFDKGENKTAFIQANGVVSGFAEGYADWILGQRIKTQMGSAKISFEYGIGAASGGGIDAGGGLLFSAGISHKYKILESTGLRAGLQLKHAMNGEFTVVSPSVDLYYDTYSRKKPYKRNFNQKVHLYSGILIHKTNANYIKNNNSYSKTPALLETTLDYFLSPNVYITGQASTAVLGDLGGYQLGLFGVGYEKPLSSKISASFETLMGAGGGAGVDTKGGLIGGVRSEIDYWVSPSKAITLGIGKVKSIAAGGMAPLTLNVGFKVSFRS